MVENEIARCIGVPCEGLCYCLRAEILHELSEDQGKDFPAIIRAMKRALDRSECQRPDVLEKSIENLNLNNLEEV